MILTTSRGPASVSPPAPLDGWQLMPEHPGRAGKRARRGTEGDPTIASLLAHDGRVYIGHGDWDKNDGPTDVVSLDPVSGTYTVHVEAVPSDGISRFAVLDGVVVGLFSDPVGYWEVTQPLVRVDGGPVGPAYGLHFLGAAAIGGTWWVCGSALQADASGAAAVWWSTDQAATWTREWLPPGLIPGMHHRAWYVGPTDAGEVAVSVTDAAYVRTGPGQWRREDELVDVLYARDKAGTTVQLGETTMAYARTATHDVAGDRGGNLWVRPRTEAAT